MSRVFVFTFLLIALLHSAFASESAKRIVVQLRHDSGEVVSVSVLSARSSDGSLRVTQFAQRATPRGSFWYVGAVFRLGQWRPPRTAFAEVAGAGQRAREGKLTVDELRDGDIIVLHHPYPKP